MKTLSYIFIYSIIMASVFQPLRSQILSTRNLVAILPNDTAGVGKVMASTAFAGEFGRGFGSAGGDHAWSLKLTGLAEIYRFSERSALVFLLGHEMNANPWNDIAFNPRVAHWEENISYYYNSDNLSWQAGFFQRCKHDIDNSDHPEGDRQRENTPVKRNIILTGLQGGISSIEINDDNSFLMSTYKLEAYLFNSDFRAPDTLDNKSWKNLRASFSAGLRYHHKFDETVSIYNRSNATLLFFSADPGYEQDVYSEYNARIEFGLSLAGPSGSIDIFTAYERFFDEVADVVPRSSDVFQFGVRMRAGIFY